MKKFTILLYMLVAVVCVHAQIDTADKATTDLTDDEDMVDPSRDRIIMNIHWDGWMGAPDSFNVKGLSSGLGFHFFYDIPLGSDNVSFAIGAGLSWSNYYNNSYFTYDTAQVTIPVQFDDSIPITKNKLVINYLEVPLEFRFRTDPKKGNSFKVAVGFKGGYVLSDHTKFVGEDYISGSDDEIKYKNYRTKNLGNLQYGPTLRIGYSKVNLEAYYGLSTIFEEGKGPSGTPITVGVSFNPF